MLKKLDKILSTTEEAFIALGILTSAILLFVNVIMRYFFDHAIVWAEEFTRYAIIWVTFIGGSVAVRNGAHLSVSALAESLNATNKKRLMYFVYIISISFTVFLVIWGFSLTMQVKVTNQLTPAMEIPAYLIYLAIPVGGLLMTLRFVQEFIKEIKRPLDDEALGKEAV